MENLKKTCLYDKHVALNAKMEEFAGYSMPIVYDSIKNEHLAVRNNVGMFDVSHMGEIIIKGKDALAFVEKLFTNKVETLNDGQVAYGMMLYQDAGVVDDLLVYRLNEEYFLLVVNASNVAKDYSWIVENSSDFDVLIQNVSEDYQEIAVQGPASEEKILSILNIDLKDLAFFYFANYEYKNHHLLISRTGYTGEDGFEIYASAEAIEEIWDVLLENDVVPCGLGSRDTLRFEAALPLYGHELSKDINPLEAGLGFFVKLKSDIDFIGKNALLEKEENLTRRIVGIELTERSIPREGYEVYKGDNLIGYITTGYLSISLEKPIAMAMINRPFTKKDTEVLVKVRNKMIPGFVRDKKFLDKKYNKTKGA
ncbi:MAG: glycine cleavage system aminomethyltransferase GcvT [Candidatus Izemoplasmatales bacterium]|jgi:aminomethyltransferase|nr:glycine cleavage system aminomethyltransferase GcvT [Candidatus Izemoplasmatales bacterium]